MRRTLTYLWSWENGNALPIFVAGILFVGSVRFGLSIYGFGNDVARYASMTVVILAAIVYYSTRVMERPEQIVVSYALIAPYMLVETLALGYTWRTGSETIFHVPPYTLGFDLTLHFWGHIVGGLTWEPLVVFILVSGGRRILLRD